MQAAKSKADRKAEKARSKARAKKISKTDYSAIQMANNPSATSALSLIPPSEFYGGADNEIGAGNLHLFSHESSADFASRQLTLIHKCHLTVVALMQKPTASMQNLYAILSLLCLPKNTAKTYIVSGLFSNISIPLCTWHVLPLLQKSYQMNCSLSAFDNPICIWQSQHCPTGLYAPMKSGTEQVHSTMVSNKEALERQQAWESPRSVCSDDPAHALHSLYSYECKGPKAQCGKGISKAEIPLSRNYRPMSTQAGFQAPLRSSSATTASNSTFSLPGMAWVSASQLSTTYCVFSRSHLTMISKILHPSYLCSYCCSCCKHCSIVPSVQNHKVSQLFCRKLAKILLYVAYTQ